MKKLIIFSVLNGFISAFLLILMTDYFVSESFVGVDLSFDMFIGNIVFLAILGSIGFVFTARKQPVGRIWGAFGIEVASSVLFVIIDLILKISGVDFHFFKVMPDDNPAVGILMIYALMILIVANLVLHLIIGVFFSVVSAKKTHI